MQGDNNWVGSSLDTDGDLLVCIHMQQAGGPGLSVWLYYPHWLYEKLLMVCLAMGVCHGAESAVVSHC